MGTPRGIITTLSMYSQVYHRTSIEFAMKSLLWGVNRSLPLLTKVCLRSHETLNNAYAPSTTLDVDSIAIRIPSCACVLQQMIVGDLPATGALQHMSRVTQSVYAALLRAHIEEQGWGDVVSSQARRNTHLKDRQEGSALEMMARFCWPVSSESIER